MKNKHEIGERTNLILHELWKLRERGVPICLEFRERENFVQTCPHNTGPGEEFCEYHGGTIPKEGINVLE